MGVGLQLCNTNVITIRQMIAPPELIGRVTASFRFMAFGTWPFGSLLGGLLGTILGVAGGLFAAIAGMLLAPAVVLVSPVAGCGGCPSGCLSQFPPKETRAGTGPSPEEQPEGRRDG